MTPISKTNVACRHLSQPSRFSELEKADFIAVCFYQAALGVSVLYYLASANQSYLYLFEPISPYFADVYQCIEVFLPLLFFLALFFEHIRRPANRVKAATIFIGYMLQSVISQGGGFYLTILFWLVVAYPRSLRLQDAAKSVYITGTLVSAIIIALSISGAIPDNIRYEHGTLRYGLGFRLGIFLSYNLSGLLMCWMFAHAEKWRPIDYSVCFSIALVVYTVGNGRMSFYAVIALLVGIFFWRNKLLSKKIKDVAAHLMKACAIVCYPLLAIISFILAILVGKPEFYTNNPLVNGLLGDFISARIKYWTINLDVYGVSLRGKDAETIFPFSYPMDNVFLFYAMKWGIIVLCAICLMYVLYSHKLDAKKGFYSLYFIIVFAAFSFSAMYVYSIVTNFTLLFLGGLVAGLGSDKESCRCRRIQAANARDARDARDGPNCLSYSCNRVS